MADLASAHHLEPVVPRGGSPGLGPGCRHCRRTLLSEGVHEVGSELVLLPDGRFQYFLAYGAYDENATGDWRVQGDAVILNTSGGYTPPRFTLKQSLTKPGQPLTILVQNQTAQGIPGIDVWVDYGGAKPETGYTQYYGWRAPGPSRKPKAIGLGVKMYNLEPQWFQVAGTSHNYYVFTFDPGRSGQGAIPGHAPAMG